MTYDEQLFLLAVTLNAPSFGGGNITDDQSAIYALTEWANSCERKLCQLSVGYVLPRDRHRKWAETILPQCFRLMRKDTRGGYLLLPCHQRELAA